MRHNERRDPIKVYALVKYYAGEIDETFYFRTSRDRDNALIEYSSATAYSPEITYGKHEFYK